MSGVPASVLDGVPLAVKGNFLLKDVPMNTARTQLLREHVPTHCASLVGALHPLPFVNFSEMATGQLPHIALTRFTWIVRAM